MCPTAQDAPLPQDDETRRLLAAFEACRAKELAAAAVSESKPRSPQHRIGHHHTSASVARRLSAFGLVPGRSAGNIAAFFAVRITVRKCVGLHGLARTYVAARLLQVVVFPYRGCSFMAVTIAPVLISKTAEQADDADTATVNSPGSVRLDAPLACDPRLHQGMQTHDPSIPMDLCLGF